MVTKVAVNLPVRDLAESARFFSALGFHADERLTNANTIAHVISDGIYVVLATDSHFKTITKKETPDTAATCEAIMQLQVESRHRVDELADKALVAGALPSNEPNDQGFPYGRSFRDLDGHQWDVFRIDLGATENPVVTPNGRQTPYRKGPKPSTAATRPVVGVVLPRSCAHAAPANSADMSTNRKEASYGRGIRRRARPGPARQ